MTNPRHKRIDSNLSILSAQLHAYLDEDISGPHDGSVDLMSLSRGTLITLKQLMSAANCDALYIHQLDILKENEGKES